MEWNETSLLNEIEKWRKYMITCTTYLPLHSNEVIRASQKLDDLLNTYDNYIKKRKVVTN